MDRFLQKKSVRSGNFVSLTDKVSSRMCASNTKGAFDSPAHQSEIVKQMNEKQEDKCESNKTHESSAKRICVDQNGSSNFVIAPHNFKSISAENLNLKYARIFSKQTADHIFRRLEEEIEYFDAESVKVNVFGKWHPIPRKQVSYGDSGLSYAFSGTSIPAVSWSKCKIIMELKHIVESVAQHSFNFVLVNRYKDGLDHMGEHRDDEKDLVTEAPIASLSFGQARDFIFKHKDARGVNATRKIDPVKLELEHGSLLQMQWPTNRFWYHSLPVRKKAINVRINLTFREMAVKAK